MENYGLRPLLFYLRCINDEDELEDLIKREIDVRERFVLCDSPNARNSKWVQAEVKYIKTQTNKIVEQININDTQINIEKQVKQLLFRSTIFLSYQSSDFTLAKELAEKLRQYEYLVFAGDKEVLLGSNFVKDIKVNIQESANKGYVFYFIGENIHNSHWQKEELYMALGSDASIVFIQLSSYSIKDLYPDIQKNYICINVNGIKSLQAKVDMIFNRFKIIDNEKFHSQ